MQQMIGGPVPRLHGVALRGKAVVAPIVLANTAAVILTPLRLCFIIYFFLYYFILFIYR